MGSSQRSIPPSWPPLKNWEVKVLLAMLSIIYLYYQIYIGTGTVYFNYVRSQARARAGPLSRPHCAHLLHAQVQLLNGQPRVSQPSAAHPSAPLQPPHQKHARNTRAHEGRERAGEREGHHQPHPSQSRNSKNESLQNLSTLITHNPLISSETSLPAPHLHPSSLPSDVESTVHPQLRYLLLGCFLPPALGLHGVETRPEAPPGAEVTGGLHVAVAVLLLVLGRLVCEVERWLAQQGLRRSAQSWLCGLTVAGGSGRKGTDCWICFRLTDHRYVIPELLTDDLLELMHSIENTAELQIHPLNPRLYSAYRLLMEAQLLVYLSQLLSRWIFLMCQLIPQKSQN